MTHAGAVGIPAAVAAVGPGILTAVPMTIVAMGPLSITVEGSLSFEPGTAVAVAFTLPTEAAPEILAVATARARSGPVPSGWRSTLDLTQIERPDAELVAAHATHVQFRPDRPST